MGGIIQKKALEDIRFRNDIADVVGSYIPLQRSGSALKALCPFHKEKTPSFHVNQNKQIYHCFGCGAGGDVFRFVMQYEGVDFGSAARILAAKAGIKLEFEKGSDDETDRSALYDVLSRVADFYRRILDSDAGKPAREYLAKRELSPETAAEFMIGFVPDRWDSCIQWARKHSRSLADLDAAGLVIKSEKSRDNSGFYDRFRNRLMFPIHDGQGRVIGFSGRMITAEEGAAKYVNSPETAVFRKSQILYALHKARHEIVNHREAIICEGQIDVIRCHQAGFKHAVAAQGTAFTEDHARIIKRCADMVTLVFDSDTAGQDAAVKAARIFMRSGLAVRVAQLPDDEDPDSFIRKKGAEAFGGLLANSSSAIQFQVNILQTRGDLSSEVGIMRATRSVLETIAESTSAVQRAKLIQEASRLLNIPQNALNEELAVALKTAQRTAERTTVAAKPPEPVQSVAAPVEERQLAEHIVAEPALGHLVEQYLPDEMFADRASAVIIHAACKAHAENTNLVACLSGQNDPDGSISRLAAHLQMAPSKAGTGEFSRENAVQDLILAIRRRDLKNRRASLEKLIQAGNADADTRDGCVAITHSLKSLQKWKTALPILEEPF